MSKILIISPTPTHPTTAGNRQHVLNVANALKKKGHDLFFLYLAYEDFDTEQLQGYWGDSLQVVPKNKLYEKGPFIKYVVWRLTYMLKHQYRKLQLAGKFISREQFLYNSEADVFFSRNIGHTLSALAKKGFDTVICEYVFTSKALNWFDSSVKKIIDTHDQFTDRFNVYLNSNMNPEWISLYKSEEAKGLQRADNFIAMQDKERAYFEQLCGKKGIVFFNTDDYIPVKERPFTKKLLYIASANINNLKAIAWFEADILPLIQRLHPDVSLLVGGSVCEKYKPLNPAITTAGSFNELSAFYTSGDIVINPELSGTGFKMKTLEGINYGKPVIATVAGANGLLDTNTNNEHLLVVNSAEEFAEGLDRLLTDEGLRNRLVKNGRDWVAKKKEKASQDFEKIFRIKNE